MKILPIGVLNRKGLEIYSNKSIDNNKMVNNSYDVNNVNQVSFAGNNTNFNTFEYGYSTEELKDRLSPKKYTKWTLVDVDSDVYKNLNQGDKKTLEHLVKAAEAFDSVYKRLDNVHNLEFEKFLNLGISKGEPQAILTKKLYDGQKGIIGKTVSGQAVALAKNVKVMPGKGFYPEDLTEKEFHQILINMLEKEKVDEVRNILNQRSVVLRDNDELKAIDYTEFFKPEFSKAADELELAAKTSTNKDFTEYLILQAKALRENDPNLDCVADKKWATLQDTPLEFTIGRECYSDKMTPTVVKNPKLKAMLDMYDIPVYAKDNIGVRVGIVNPQGTKYLLGIKKYLPLMAEKMPLKDQYKQNITSSNNVKQTMVDAHIVDMTGANGAYRGGISIASNLPNSDKLAVQTGGGFRNVYNKDLREAKYADGAEKKLNAVLNDSYHKYFKTDSLHDFTILHENLHSLGPKEGLEMLGVYKNTIEEYKADVGSLAMLEELKKQGFYSPQKQKEIITSLIFGYTPLGADINNAHVTRNVMQHNYFIQNGGIIFDSEGKMKIDFAKITECARQMLHDAIEIQLSKNEKMAKDYIEKYAVWTDELDMLATKLKSVDTRLNSYLYSPIAKKVLKSL